MQLEFIEDLIWPENKRRTEIQQPTIFRTTLNSALYGLNNNLRLLGVEHAVVSSEMALQIDSTPYENQDSIWDSGVAVYFSWDDEEYCLACDRWDEIEGNIQALQKTIDSLRGIERWGSTDMLKSAFTGYLALPESTHQTCWDILGIDPTHDLEIIKKSFRELAKKKHPDSGGNENMMAELNKAYAEAKEYVIRKC